MWDSLVRFCWFLQSVYLHLELCDAALTNTTDHSVRLSTESAHVSHRIHPCYNAVDACLCADSFAARSAFLGGSANDESGDDASLPFGGATLMWYSACCAASSSPGASVIRQRPALLFGKAITSRIDGA